MPDQDQLNDFLEALEEVGSPAKNPVLREALGWEEPFYEEVKTELVRKGIVVRGRGRSDSVSLVGAEPGSRPPPRPATAARPEPSTAPPKTNPSNPGSGKPPARSAAPRTRRNTRTTSCR
jgi:type I restriction enzyme M protein